MLTSYGVKMVMAIVGLTVVVIASVMIIGFWAESAVCHSKWSDRNPSWGLFSGCMIDTNEGRIPAENFRVL